MTAKLSTLIFYLSSTSSQQAFLVCTHDYIDLAEFAALDHFDIRLQAFKICSGELEEVLLQLDKSAVCPVMDSFGEDT